MKRSSGGINHLFNFVAVILGVYLAFFMNERAKTNRDREEAKVFMASLISDLADDVRLYSQFQIPANRQQLDQIEEFLEVLIREQPKEIGAHLPVVFQVENFAPTSTTYSSVKASGKLGMISNLDLQKELSDYYETSVEESGRKSEYQVDYFTSELLPWVTEHIDLTTGAVLHTEALVELRNKLIIYQSLIEQKVKSYETIVKESETLRDRLESVLAE